MAASTYFKNSLEFLMELYPSISTDLFSKLVSVSSPTLNAMFDIVGKCYLFARENTGTLLSALLSVYNFYLRTQEATSLTSLSVGFLDMIQSIFGFSNIPSLLKIVSELIVKTFESISKYFLKAEATAEKSVESFWKMMEGTDSRSIFNIVYELSGVSATCALVYNLYHSQVETGAIAKVVSIVSTHFLDAKSEIRLRLKSATQAIARVIDYICLNYEFMIKGEFHNISWKLPGPIKFENDYSEFCARFERYMANPFSLQEENLTLANLRDQAKSLIVTANAEIAATAVGAVKSSMVRYLQTLNHHHHYLVEQLNPNNTKPQPMSLVLCGPPGCGKSSMSTSLGKIMQKIANRTPDEDKIKNRGGDPKFEPAIFTSTEVIISDDFGNDTSTPISAKEVLDIVNVTREVIPKAAVEEKNKFRYSNIGAIFTTNDENVGVGQIRTISYESILRRFGLVVFIHPQEQYCVPGSEVLDRNHPYLSGGVERADIYDIEIKKPVTVENVNGKKSIIYSDVEGWRRDGLCDLKSCIIYLRNYLEKEWDKSVSQHASRHSVERICPDCSLERMVCVCKECAPDANEEISTISEEDSVEELQAEAFKDLDKYYDDFHSGLQSFMDSGSQQYDEFDSYGQLWMDVALRKISVWNCYRLSASMMCSSLSTLWTHRYTYLLGLLYTSLVCLMTPSFLCIPWIAFISCLYFQNLPCKISLMIGTACSLLATYQSLFMVFFSAIAIPYCWISSQKEHLRKQTELTYQRQARSIREYYYGRMAFYATVGSASSLFVLLMGFKAITPLFRKTVESKRDITLDPYLPNFKPSNSDDKTKYFYVAQPDNSAKTSARSEAISYIGRKMLVVRVETATNPPIEVRAIPCGSELLLPAHAIPSVGRFTIRVCADRSKRTSEYVDTDLGQDSYRILKDRNGKPVDAALLHFSNIPVQPNLAKYFTSGQQPVSGPGQELYKSDQGTYELIDLRLSIPGMFDITQYKDEYRGTIANYPALKCMAQSFSSENGMCGSPILSEDSNCILGFHIAGNGTNTWFGLRITRDMIDEARSRLIAESKNFISLPMPEQFTVQKKNPHGFQFDDTSETLAIEAIGQTESPIEEIGMIYKGHQLYADRAEKHYFTNRNPKLEEAFGPRNTQPPQFPNGEEQINSTLKKLHKPKFDVPIDLIDRAVDDYLNSSTIEGVNFNKIIDDLKSTRDDFFTVRELDEALRGDQTGIVRGINNASSAGWIYGGKKTVHYNMDVEGDPLEIRDLVPEIREDIKEQEIRWRNGEGTYDPFKRCSKTNELLPWQKALEKTRSFYGNDMTFFLNMMRGVIPHKHILRTDKELSECFVGITAQSKEWRQLKRFLTRNGKFKNFVCGDFSGYDTQLPKALLDKAAWILLEMAKRGGMSESDLTFLRGALTSVTSPTLFWQGHVLRMANGQPSGQPLTVEINSIINSLLMRMVFYTIMDEEYPHLSEASFRDYVALATYGDDNALGVDSSIPLYNHTKIQSVFARWGISYTMADKEADSVPYQSIEEISFLKRSFRDHPDLGIVAPIEYDSIVKCFYYWVRGKNTPLTFPQQFRELVKSQVREAALHGEEFYDRFCKGILLLQEGSLEMNEEFHIKWNGFDLPVYEDLIEDLSEAY